MPMKRMSEAQIWLLDYLKERWGAAKAEHQFYPGRKWRFDAVVLRHLYAFEIEGGIWTKGAHVRGEHYESDMSKYNTAQALGWKVFRFTPEQILKGEAKQFIEQWLPNQEGWRKQTSGRRP